MAREWLGPQLIRKDIQSGQQLQQELSIYKGNPFAKAALDIAWWSLHCRLINQPLHTAIGARRTEVPVGADFGVMDFVNLFANAVKNREFDDMTERQKKAFYPFFEYSVSDHMPIWVRVPRPD